MSSTVSGAGGATRRYVPVARAVVLSYQVLIRQIATPGKLVALGLLGALMVLVGLLVGVSSEEFTPREFMLAEAYRRGADYANGFGLIVIVPIVSLVFASSVLGEAREDGTLVYLWLRPMNRFPVAAGASLAAVTVALPLTVIPTALGGWLAADRVAGSGDLVAGGLVAAASGTFAYSALFVLVGLVLRKPIIWGIAYILLWEGLAVGLGDFAARLSLRGYTQSLLSRIGSVDIGVDAHSTVTAVIVLAAVAVASLVLAAVRLARMEVA